MIISKFCFYFQKCSWLIVHYLTMTEEDQHSFQTQLRMRIRLNYNLNGSPVSEQGEVNEFPAALYQ